MDVASVAIVVAALGVTSGPAQAERIVRGQEESPYGYTARFQGDDGWSGDRYSPANSGGRQFDQRGAAIGAEPIRTAQAPPWTLDSAQRATADAGNSLRDTVTSGVEQTAQQIGQSGQQLLDGAQNAGRDFGRQLQNMTGLGSQSAPPRSAPSTSRSSKSWPAPPPLTESIQPLPESTSPSQTKTPTAWSSIRPELAPPRLATPPMTNGVRVASSGERGTRSEEGSEARSSILVPRQDWSSIGETGSASSTTSSDADADGGLVPVPPRIVVPNTQPRPPSTEPDTDGWAWPTVSTPATITANSTPASESLPADGRYAQPAAPATAATGQPIQSASQQIPESPPAIVTRPAEVQQPAQTASGEEVPWKPLLLAVLALAGSLGANLFLVVSYADARQRYRALVAKTTHSFQQAAGIAA